MKQTILMVIFALLLVACNRIPDNAAKGADQCVTEIKESISNDKSTSLDDILEKYWNQYQGKDRDTFCSAFRVNLLDKNNDDIVLALGNADYSQHPLYKEYLINILGIAYKEGVSMLNNLGGKPDSNFKNTPTTAALLTGSLLADYYDTNDTEGANSVLRTAMNHLSDASLWEKVEFASALKEYFKLGENGIKAYKILSDSHDGLAIDFMRLMLESNLDL